MNLAARATALGAVGLFTALACAACGSSPQPPSLASQVTSITDHTNASLTADGKFTNPAQSNARYAEAFRLAATQFKALHVPASARHDLTVLVDDLNQMATLAGKTAALAAKDQSVEANVTAYAEENLKLMEAETAEKKDADTLRKDVGLPPEATTTTTQPSTTTTIALTPTTAAALHR